MQPSLGEWSKPCPTSPMRGSLWSAESNYWRLHRKQRHQVGETHQLWMQNWLRVCRKLDHYQGRSFWVPQIPWEDYGYKSHEHVSSGGRRWKGGWNHQEDSPNIERRWEKQSSESLSLGGMDKAGRWLHGTTEINWALLSCRACLVAEPAWSRWILKSWNVWTFGSNAVYAISSMQRLNWTKSGESCVHKIGDNVMTQVLPRDHWRTKREDKDED